VKFDNLNADKILVQQFANQCLQDVKCALKMVENSLNNFLQLLVLSAGCNVSLGCKSNFTTAVFRKPIYSGMHLTCL
jgi:hypothetical protein